MGLSIGVAEWKWWNFTSYSNNVKKFEHFSSHQSTRTNTHTYDVLSTEKTFNPN